MISPRIKKHKRTRFVRRLMKAKNASMSLDQLTDSEFKVHSTPAIRLSYKHRKIDEAVK